MATLGSIIFLILILSRLVTYKLRYFTPLLTLQKALLHRLRTVIPSRYAPPPSLSFCSAASAKFSSS